MFRKLGDQKISVGKGNRWELEWKGLFLVLAPKDFANGEKGESRCCQIKRENIFLDLVSSAWGLSGRRMGFKGKEEIVLQISPLLFVASAKNVVSHTACWEFDFPQAHFSISLHAHHACQKRKSFIRKMGFQIYKKPKLRRLLTICYFEGRRLLCMHVQNRKKNFFRIACTCKKPRRIQTSLRVWTIKKAIYPGWRKKEKKREQYTSHNRDNSAKEFFCHHAQSKICQSALFPLDRIALHIFQFLQNCWRMSYCALSAFSMRDGDTFPPAVDWEKAERYSCMQLRKELICLTQV